MTKVIPPRADQGSDEDLTITGKNFVEGAKVSFANSGVRALSVAFTSSTQLIVRIRVAGDASVGTASLFVINPDENEAEAAFEITAKGATLTTTTPKPGSPTAPVAPVTQRFDAYHNLGNPTELFHARGKIKGTLILSSGTVSYEEDNKTLINISLSEIEEVKTAPMGGFEIKVSSGKTFHFTAASLKSSDAKIIVESIRKAMPTPKSE